MLHPSRRDLLAATSLAAGSLALPPAARGVWPALGRDGNGQPPAPSHPILLSLKFSMIAGDASVLEKMQRVRDIGFDGVEFDSPNGFDTTEVLAARDATGLPIHGVVDSVHWNERLSDPDPAVREKGITGLETALRDSKAYGGSSVLLVPGRVADPEKENHDQVWERSIEGIRRVLPLAARLGIRILIENVWNGFCYQHDGPSDQDATQLAAYLDEIASPWVGAYFDIGNHRKYGRPEQWIRTLGPRIVKCDVKDWGVEAGWARIGEGDVDWPAVRAALAEVGFTGWATAEVGGGDAEHLAGVYDRMRAALHG